jgi:hypothetical protein
MLQVWITPVPQRVSPLLHWLHSVPAASQVCVPGHGFVTTLPLLQLRSVLPTHAALAVQWPVESHTIRLVPSQLYAPGVHS